jgi:hypothetical protein
MKVKTSILTFGTILMGSAFAGTEPSITMAGPCCDVTDAFASAIRPMSNPTLFDLALPRTNAHAIAMFQQMPDQVATGSGGRVPLGGDFQAYALQLEYALNERLSIVATKDGYVDFNPDATLSEESGFANIAAGLKYAFIYQSENAFVLSGTTTIEVPTGSDDITQGSGDGAVNLILSGLKMYNGWQFAGGGGLHIPFDSDAESMTSFVSSHVSYEVCQYFIPLIELNWFHVLNEGDGGSRYGSQLNGELPSAIGFEGGDLLNWGASNGGENADIVTLVAGFRSKLCDNVNVGVAYEIPLTEEEENLMESRVTLDLVWNF